MSSIDPVDAGLARALREFRVQPDALLGIGGEACVYALDRDRIIRVHHSGTEPATVSSRRKLLEELALSATRVPFAIPRVLEIVEVEGRVVAVELRLPGRTLTDVLAEASGESRAALVRAYMDAAAQIGDLTAARTWYGDLCRAEPIRTATFREYLERRAAQSLALAGERFAQLVPAELAVALPEPDAPALVHLDAFPGNMLADGEEITAVIDFSVISIVGDRRLDPLCAAMYLTPYITPSAIDADRAVATEWIRARGLAELMPAAQRWVAAFWTAATDEARLQQWCREVLCE